MLLLQSHQIKLQNLIASAGIEGGSFVIQSENGELIAITARESSHLNPKP